MNRTGATIGAAIGMALVLLATHSAWAVKSETWTHEQPKQFLEAKLDNVVVGSDGEVMLGQEFRTLREAKQQAEVINALARAADGMIYAATGPNGIIYRISGEEVSEFATLPKGGSAMSLLFAADGKLLVGTGGGSQARIYALDGAGNARLFYEPKGARYVWAMVRGPQGQVYAATGIEGQLYVIEADGKGGKVLAHVKPKNLLCLAYGPDDRLYAGTDEDGLVYRINPVNPAAGSLYVMYDAKEAEISDLVIDLQGNIYVSTAAADQARPGRSVADKPGGKPDRPSKGAQDKPAETKPSRDNGKGDEKPSNGKKDEEKAAEDFKAQLRKLGATQAVGRVAGQAPQGGNAIYHIDPDGFVTEVFREPVMVLALAEAEGTIYAATGNEGRLYAITPGQDHTTMIARLKAEQATALLRLPDGQLMVGTANPPTLVRVSRGRAPKGTLISKPLDAGQIVKWGRVAWEAAIPTGTRLTVATRSGNVEDDESDAWEAWSQELDATAPQQIASAGARFLQYRLTFETTVPEATASLRRITMARIEENRPPQITALEVVSAREEAKNPAGSPKVKALVGAGGLGEKGPPSPDFYQVVKWKAEDPNKDDLLYNVFHRPTGTTRWVRLAKEIKETLGIWDTRTVPDGKYEVRVVADDSPSNPPSTRLEDARISDPITVDNTPPEATIDRLERSGEHGVLIHATLTDALSFISEASYCVDSDEKWVPLSADDDLFDSPHEPVTFTIDDLEPGEHWIALRVIDQQGNCRYVSRNATVGN